MPGNRVKSESVERNCLRTEVNDVNFIFISPNFPHTYWQYCQRLKENGATVLGIGDAPFDGLEDGMRVGISLEGGTD